MAISRTVIIGGILAGMVVTSVTLILVGLSPLYNRGDSSSSSSGATTSVGSASTTAVGSGSSTTIGSASTTTAGPGVTTTAAGATTTTTTTTTTTVSVPLPTCNSNYSAIVGHSICIANSNLLLSAGLVAGDKQVIVDRHNLHRRNPYPKGTPKYGSAMRELVWDNNLAAIAQQYARSCPADHEASNNMRKVIGLNVIVGQNLAWGYTAWTEAIDGWFSEYLQFTYGSGGTEVGHYTQMVYDETTRVGCGYTECDTGFNTYYVCDYATIQYSNKMNSPFVVGAPCASCVNKCDNGLCDCNGLLCNTGTIDLNTCTCK